MHSAPAECVLLFSDVCRTSASPCCPSASRSCAAAARTLLPACASKQVLCRCHCHLRRGCPVAAHPLSSMRALPDPLSVVHPAQWGMWRGHDLEPRAPVTGFPFRVGWRASHGLQGCGCSPCRGECQPGVPADRRRRRVASPAQAVMVVETSGRKAHRQLKHGAQVAGSLLRPWSCACSSRGGGGGGGGGRGARGDTPAEPGAQRGGAV